MDVPISTTPDELPRRACSLAKPPLAFSSETDDLQLRVPFQYMLRIQEPEPSFISRRAGGSPTGGADDYATVTSWL